jgi:hypothetical protein
MKQCKKGHDLNSANMYQFYQTKNGNRYLKTTCKICRNNNKKEWLKTDKGKKYSHASKDRTHNKHPEKRKARLLIYTELRSGRLKKPDICSIKDSNCYGSIDGHHDDYSKPLEVRWLCTSHHRAIHGYTTAVRPDMQVAVSI